MRTAGSKGEHHNGLVLEKKEAGFCSEAKGKMVPGRPCLGKGYLSMLLMRASFSTEPIGLPVLPGNNEKDRHRSRLGG